MLLKYGRPVAKCRKCFVMKVDRRFHRCTDIKCPLCLSKMRTLFGPFWPFFFIGCMVSADYWLADYPELRRTTQPSTIGGPLGKPGFCIFCSTAYQGSTLMLVHELLTFLSATVDGRYVWYGILKKCWKIKCGPGDSKTLYHAMLSDILQNMPRMSVRHFLCTVISLPWNWCQMKSTYYKS